MNRSHHDVIARWLNSRAPSARTGTEAEKFADECWVTDLRLATSQSIHYQQIMDLIRWSLTG